MARRKVYPPWPLESQQAAADYLDRVLGYDPAERWDRQPYPAVAPCVACGGERLYGRLCCGVVTPPARQSRVHGEPPRPAGLPLPRAGTRPLTVRYARRGGSCGSQVVRPGANGSYVFAVPGDFAAVTGFALGPAAG